MDESNDKKRPAPSGGASVAGPPLERPPSAPPAKRVAAAKDDGSNDGKNHHEGHSDSSPQTLNVCDQIGLKVGNRLEVLCLDYGDDDDDDDDGLKKGSSAAESSAAAADAADAAAASSSKPIKYWLAATLLPFEGDYQILYGGDDDEDDDNKEEEVEEEQVAIAVHALQFDACPDRGIAEGISDVCFLSDHAFVDAADDDSTRHYRREGSSWEPVFSVLAGIPTLSEFMGEEYKATFERWPATKRTIAGEVWEEVASELMDRIEEDEGRLEADAEELTQLIANFHRVLEETVKALKAGPRVNAKGGVDFSYKDDDGAREQVRKILDGVLAASFQKQPVAETMRSTPAAAQAIAAEKIAASQELMVDKIVERMKASDDSVFTEEMMQSVVMEVMQTMRENEESM
mmetsp:Transcript_11806/g.27895  ORF Transcript_11806/g.27895 Transcript_11806/m.27895 type:complete len:403 (+) Transcript_11806:80-1288(+)|eukprot:CAMPEP_0185828422 /NCGR_PEP_ID=MMETSP1322-20130828/32543_1 /TAXON_ID=265543 /ORGANISM="Minutocellus polymorphus, Strain RCC2270" /LENGTH=402 /DNA_ID=CAMNT_0028526161 /DNA_START=35 /DNA_END=1243 /DNA_ORIENTATION=-